MQHKQIRPNDRESSHTPGAPPGTYAGAVGGAEDGLHRSQYHGALPPSGAGTPWFQQGAETGSEEGVVVAGGSKLDDSNAETATSTTATEPSSTMGLDAAAASPLASLGTLQSALPDVAAAGKTGSD